MYVLSHLYAGSIQVDGIDFPTQGSIFEIFSRTEGNE